MYKKLGNDTEAMESIRSSLLKYPDLNPKDIDQVAKAIKSVRDNKANYSEVKTIESLVQSYQNAKELQRRLMELNGLAYTLSDSVSVEIDNTVHTICHPGKKCLNFSVEVQCSIFYNGERVNSLGFLMRGGPGASLEDTKKSLFARIRQLPKHAQFVPNAETLSKYARGDHGLQDTFDHFADLAKQVGHDRTLYGQNFLSSITIACRDFIKPNEIVPNTLYDFLLQERDVLGTCCYIESDAIALMKRSEGKYTQVCFECVNGAWQKLPVEDLRVIKRYQLTRQLLK